MKESLYIGRSLVASRLWFRRSGTVRFWLRFGRYHLGQKFGGIEHCLSARPMQTLERLKEICTRSSMDPQVPTKVSPLQIGGRQVFPSQRIFAIDRRLGSRNPDRLWRRRVTDQSYFHDTGFDRSEEHTSELQSLRHLVCRLL